METQKTTVCLKTFESLFENCDKNSNEKITTKRKRNDPSTGLNFDVNENRNHQCERLQLTFDDLPTEILEAIFRNVASADLINCRLVNRKWNEISSKIIRQRADIQITFSSEYARLMTMDLMSLGDLVGCLEQSNNFPFSNFRFENLGTKAKVELEPFLSIWGKNIYELVVKMDDEVNNAKMLRFLLFEKMPNLKRLGIEFTFDFDRKSIIRLFPNSNKFELPKLNTLRVSRSFGKHSAIVEDILEATPNLKLFEKCSLDNHRQLSECVTARELNILQSLDKLHCLEHITLMLTEDMISCLEKHPQILNLELGSIELPPDWFRYDRDRLYTRGIKIINKIFDSSKNSLRTLKIPPMGWLEGLVLPKFGNLQTLVLSHDEEDDDDDVVYVYCMFPPLYDMSDNFPNLERLTVYFNGEDEYFETFEPVNVLPKVEFLAIHYDDRYDEKLMKMTPNVKTLLVSNGSEGSPSMNFHDIATYLPKLEHLSWTICGNSQHALQTTCDLDGLLTGYSKVFCKVKSVEFRDKRYLSKREVADYEQYRRYTSLVDLKELRRFDMRFDLDHDSYKKCGCGENCDCSEDDDDDDETCDNAGFNRRSKWYQSSLTKVSKLLAFDLMPDLETDLYFTWTG